MENNSVSGEGIRLTSDETSVSTATILIVDDTEAFREMVVKALRLQGFKTIEAENGHAGVQLANVYIPDLILSDVRMGGFDGFAALSALRYQARTKSIPVIMMTGHPTEHGKQVAMALGASDYLVKPFTLESLITKIRVHIQNSELIRQQALKGRLKHVSDAVDLGGFDADIQREPNDLNYFSDSEKSSEAETRFDTTHSGETLADAPSRSEFWPASDDQLATASIHDAELIVKTHLRMLNRFHPNLGNTAMRTEALCRKISRVVGLPPEESRDLCWAAALHDISLIGLDQEAVRRWLQDSRKVTEEEYGFIRNHPIESQRMLEDAPIFKRAGEIIRFHHERWDGTGYPCGLQAEKIPRLARYLAVAIFYCSQHNLGARALKLVKAQASILFDPEVVEILQDAAETAKIPRGIREMFLNEMKDGQVLAREIRNALGNVLVKRERCLTNKLIQKLSDINRVTPLDQNVLIYC